MGWPAAATAAATTSKRVAYDHDNLPTAISLHAADDTKLVDLQLQRDPGTGRLAKRIRHCLPYCPRPAGAIARLPHVSNGSGAVNREFPNEQADQTLPTVLSEPGGGNHEVAARLEQLRGRQPRIPQ